jgi:predicted SAM-dependent methyltransferase
MGIKYHLGCGTQYKEGYINVDNPPSQHSIAIVRADIYGDLISVPLELCEEIRSHHVFEHFNYMESVALLIKWTKALELQGKLIIDIPDLEVLSQELLNSINKNDTRRIFKIVRLMCGSHEADWAFHVNAWTLSSLSYILEKFGFELVQANRYGQRDSLFPNCGLLMCFNKIKVVENIEHIGREFLSFYTDLPAQQDLFEEFKKQFDILLSKI